MTENFAKFEEFSIKQIRPKGWLKEFLQSQSTGLTGHLEVAGYPFDSISWAEPEAKKEKEKNPRWWPYEQTAYWVDGLERCGLLLDDEYLLNKADKSINYVLNNPDNEGYMGPQFMKEEVRWPHVVMFRAFMAKYSALNDKKIIEKLTDHYLNHKFDYSNERDVDNVEIMLWLYLQNGNKTLLDLAVKSYKEYNEKCLDDCCDKMVSTSKKFWIHGVSFNEYFKLGAILYICTGDNYYLNVSVKAYNKLDRYFMLVDGLHNSEEKTFDANYMRTHEACNVTDFTWSLGYLLMATGDAKWADKIERCIFNAGIGHVTEDFRALQYFSCPNQLVLDRTSNHAIYHKGIYPAMCYKAMPMTECCPANISRAMPNYCARMWFKKDNNIYAALYGSNTLNADGITIKEMTNYPFEYNINFDFSLLESKTFSLFLRIPSWCKNPTVKVNGKIVKSKIDKGFFRINRTFKNGDNILLELPSEIEVKDYRSQGNFVEKGPLVYSFGMYGKRTPDPIDKNCNEDFPANIIYPDKDWNYRICTDKESIKEYKFKANSIDGNPWDIRTTPVSITAPAQKLNGWKLQNSKKIKGVNAVYNFYTKEGDFVFTPKHPTKKFIEKNGIGDKEYIKLVPLATAKLRLTIFPKD